MLGWYSLIAAWHGAREVYGIEIIREYAEFADHCLRINGIKGKIYNAGVGKGKETIIFKDSLADAHVVCCELDSFGIRPDFMKMDIEGFEYDALQSGYEVFKKKPKLDISIHPAYLEKKGQSAETVEIFLKKMGYKTIEEFSDTLFMV